MSTASTATLEPKTELEGSGPRKASALRVLRMLETAMGPTIAALLKDPDVIEIRCNADGKIYADWLDKPSSWTGQTLSSDMATQVVCIVADAVDQIEVGVPFMRRVPPVTNPSAKFSGVHQANLLEGSGAFRGIQ